MRRIGRSVCITEDPGQSDLSEYVPLTPVAIKRLADEVMARFAHRSNIYRMEKINESKKDLEEIMGLIKVNHKTFIKAREKYDKYRSESRQPEQELVDLLKSTRSRIIDLQDEMREKKKRIGILDNKYTKWINQTQSKMALIHSRCLSCIEKPPLDIESSARHVVSMSRTLTEFMLRACPGWNADSYIISKTVDGKMNHIIRQRDLDTISSKHVEMDDDFECSACHRYRVGSVTGKCSNCGSVYNAAVYNRNDPLSFMSRCDVPVDGDISVTDPGKPIGAWKRRGKSYKRLNHFKECVRQMQGLTVSKVNPKSVHALRELLKFSSDKEIHSLTPSTCRRMLECVRDHRSYENSVSLCVILNPKFKPLVLTPEQTSRLYMRFLCLEDVFDDAKAKMLDRRKNFPSYHYIFGRLCELENITHPSLETSIRTLKSRKLTAAHDRIWTHMCNVLGWGKADSENESMLCNNE